MKQNLCKSILMIVVSLMVYSCGSSSDSSFSIKEKFPPVKIKRMDAELYKFPKMSADEQSLFNTEMKSGISAITTMLNMGHPDDSAYVKYVNSDAVKMFTPEVEKKFSDISDLENVLGGVKQNMKKELPHINMCEIYSIVSPYKQSIYIADSTLLLALNHYLGAEHKAYDGFEEYIKKTKQAKYIPYDIVEATIGTFNPYETIGDEKVLSKMLFAGAIVEAKMRIVPEASLSMALGYDEKELEWVEDNQQQLWNALVSKELLYSTSYMDINQLLSLSPCTSILHQQAPGRVGRYLGYKIIRAYLEKNPSTTLSQLLTPEFYKSQQTLINSGYQGK